MISPGDFTTLLILSIFRLLLFISGKPGHKDDSFWRRQKFKRLPLPRISTNQQMICCQYGGCCYESPVTGWVFSVWYLSYFFIFLSWKEFFLEWKTPALWVTSFPASRLRRTGQDLLVRLSLHRRACVRDCYSGQFSVLKLKFLVINSNYDLNQIYRGFIHWKRNPIRAAIVKRILL